MKKGHIKVRTWTGFELDLIGTDVSYILGFFKKDVKLDPMPTWTKNGLTIEVGSVILRLGGTKTSAGFSTIWFDDENDGADGGGLIYKGKFRGLDGKYLCFTQLRNFIEVKPAFDKYKLMYFAFLESGLPGLEWMFTNQAGAGRISETTNVILRRYKHDG